VKAVRVSALKKAQGAFLLLHEHEWAALDGMPAWVTRLFLLLVRCADFKTGHGETGYPWLAGALTPMQPARGPRLFAPSTQDVKRQVLELEQLRIVARDKRHSDATKTLFFSIAPRFAQARPQKNSTPKLDPHLKAAKRATARPAEESTPKLDPSTRPPLPEANSFIGRDELSTSAKPSRAVLEMRSKLRPRAGGTP